MRNSMVKTAAVAALCAMTALTALAGTESTTKPSKEVKPHGTQAMTAKPAMKGALDGKHFTGLCGMAGKTDGDKESVSFKDGLFVSSFCVNKGFKAAPYTTETKDGEVTFKSEQTDPKMGHLVWEGSIKGESLTANGTLTPEGATASSMWIKAESKANQHASHSVTKKK